MRTRLAAGRQPGPIRWAAAGWNLALLALWAKLFWPVGEYLAVLFTRQEFRTNQILLVGVLALLLMQARRSGVAWRLDAPPRLFAPGLALALLAALAYLLAERYLDINTLSAFLFGLSSYGLLGLWLPAERWRRGFPAMLLVVGVLPFGEHLETLLGYPVRAATAGLVRAQLAALGFHSVGADTILVFESGISQVDIPCSGMKSLWTGALFLLAATWIKDVRVGWRWLLVAALTMLMLLAANYARVAALALTGPALGWEFVAEMLYVPLGVLGFLAACAGALFLLDRLPAWSQPAAPAARDGSRETAPRWLSPALTLLVLAAGLAYAPRTVQAAEAPAAPDWDFPAGLQTWAAPLSEQEAEWIRQGGAETADRYTFLWGAGEQPLTGSVLLLTSQTWRGQHRPERCFTVFGLTVDESVSMLVSPDFPLRYLALSGAGGAARTSAAYWLQSSQVTTEDFGKRIWADLRPEREPWMLVTVLFDQPQDASRPELAGLFDALRATVGRSLGEERTP
jgi:exosortase O